MQHRAPPRAAPAGALEHLGRRRGRAARALGAGVAVHASQHPHLGRARRAVRAAGRRATSTVSPPGGRRPVPTRPSTTVTLSTPPGVVGARHQAARRLAQRRRRRQHLGDRGLGDVRREPVAAHQHHVALEQVGRHHVGGHLGLGAEGAGDHVAVRVVLGLLGA